MRGQSSVEMLVLISAILISVASMLYYGMGSNESTVVLTGARDGAENAIFNVDMQYGCSTNIEHVGISGGLITIEVKVRNAPPSGYSWENFSENVVENVIRDQGGKIDSGRGNAVAEFHCVVHFVDQQAARGLEQVDRNDFATDRLRRPFR